MVSFTFCGILKKVESDSMQYSRVRRRKMRQAAQIGIVFLLGILLLSILFFGLKKIFSVFEHRGSSDKVAKTVMEEIEKDGYTIQTVGEVDHYTIFLYQKEDGSYENKVIDNNKKKKISMNEIIDMEGLQNQIEDLLKNKYPVFIATAAASSFENSALDVQKDHITIYFNHVETNPKVEEEIRLTISNRDIEDLLRYQYEINDELHTETFVLDPNKKTVALTFDDGPSSNTASIVQILSDNKMNATFFELGSKMSKYPDTIKNVLASHNEIGSHTYSHKYLTKISDAEMQNEIQMTNDAFHEITGQNIQLTRPPYGSINDHVKESINTIFIGWNIDTEDWHTKDVEKIKKSVLSNVQDGAIILMHDTYDTTREAIKIILPELYVRGYQVVTVSKLAELKNVTLEQHEMYRHFK